MTGVVGECRSAGFSSFLPRMLSMEKEQLDLLLAGDTGVLLLLRGLLASALVTAGIVAAVGIEWISVVWPRATGKPGGDCCGITPLAITAGRVWNKAVCGYASIILRWPAVLVVIVVVVVVTLM